MAGSFADGTLPFYLLDLDYASRQLEWNPLPRDRQASQQLWWDRCETVSKSAQERRKPWRADFSLEIAMRRAGQIAHRLAIYHGGRIILDAEDPGEYASDPEFWFAREEYYKLEYHKLLEEDNHRASRSVTPEVAWSDVSSNTELYRAKREAGNVARMLVRFPAGKALLEAEDHGNSTKDGDYWWRLEKFQEPPSEVEDHGDSITNPAYWRNKEKLYRAKLDVERERTKLERAKRSADLRARDLATFPVGKALLEAENHGDSATDSEYWWNKKKYYEAEYDKLQEEFWERWKRTHLDGGDSC